MAAASTFSKEPSSTAIHGEMLVTVRHSEIVAEGAERSNPRSSLAFEWRSVCPVVIGDMPVETL
jgi:hypothetical protein